MTAYNVLSPSAMAAGQPEDISVILGNFQALAGIINGQLDNNNLSPGAAIAIAKLAGYPGVTTSFLRGDGTWAAPSSPVSVGITLPAAPADGDEAILVDSLTVPTYAWRFKYLTGITGANKWLFIGGSPARPAPGGANGMVTSSTAFVDLTGGPTFAVLRSGVYLVDVLGLALTAPGGVNSGYMQVLATPGGSTLSAPQAVLTNVNGISGSISLSAFVNLSAGDTVKLQVRTASALQINFGTGAVGGQGPYLTITPRLVA